MIRTLRKTHTIFITTFVCSAFFAIFCEPTNAQETIAELKLNMPIVSQIADQKPAQFRIKLSAGQTARVEALQTGADVSLTSFKPSGEKLLEWGLPIGRVGSEEILVIAKESGEYRVEVSPGNRHGGSGEFVIEVTEIRDTTESDRKKNQAAMEISRLMPEAMRTRDLETGSSRRTSIGIWNEIIRLAKIKEDRVAEARALHSIGNLLVDLGEIQQAIDNSLQVVEMWREFKNRRFEMVAMNRLGHIRRQLGEHEKAIISYEELRKISLEINSPTDVAVSLQNIGGSYLSMGMPEKALAYFEEALPIMVKSKIRIFEASVLKDLGQTYLAFGDHKKGIEFLIRALDLEIKEGYRGSTISTYLSLGKAYRDIGDTPKAFENLTRANSLASELGSRLSLVQSFYYLSLLESDEGNLEEAINALEEGLKIIEKVRGEIRDKDLRTAYFSNVQNFYELYIELLIERFQESKNDGDISLAFEMSERSRSRSLIDLLQEARVEFTKGVDGRLIESKRDLSNAINAKYQARENLIARKSAKEKIDGIDLEISDLEIESAKLDLQIKRENPRYSDLISGKTLTTEEIQDLLDDETVLLEYKLGEKSSFLWFVTNDTVKFYRLPPRKEIEADARAFYDAIAVNDAEKRNDLFRHSRKLNDVLLSAVHKEVKGKRMAIVADGILQYLPFSALQDSEASYLADTNEVVVLPSASVLAQLRANQTVAKQNAKVITVFADPVFDIEDTRITDREIRTTAVNDGEIERVLRDFSLGQTLPRLLASREEARTIASLVGSDASITQIGFDAKLQNIVGADLKDYQILHFATHGLLNSSRPELSGLVFSLFDEEGREQNGFLSLSDIYNLDLSSDMVVLSACQTALGKDIRGEGLVGLSRGFLYAGSNRIVASLWKVDDSATAEFMKHFYTNHLTKRMSASESLRTAKIEMKKIPRYRSPYYWSAFTLLGDWK